MVNSIGDLEVNFVDDVAVFVFCVADLFAVLSVLSLLVVFGDGTLVVVVSVRLL